MNPTLGQPFASTSSILSMVLLMCSTSDMLVTTTFRTDINWAYLSFAGHFRAVIQWLHF